MRLSPPFKVKSPVQIMHGAFLFEICSSVRRRDSVEIVCLQNTAVHKRRGITGTTCRQAGVLLAKLRGSGRRLDAMAAL